MSARVVLVTGGASGIRGAIAAAFAASGDRVVIADRDAEAAARAAEDLDARAVTMDVTDAASVTAGVARVAETLGPVEVLVNNAGVVAGGGPLTSLPWRSSTRSSRSTCAARSPSRRRSPSQMIEHGVRGRIVNISSIGARQPTAASATTKPRRRPWTPHPHRCAGTRRPRHPGERRGARPRPHPDDGRAHGEPGGRGVESRIPLRKIAATDDVAPLVLFLASDRANHITGAIVQVDGGQLLT